QLIDQLAAAVQPGGAYSAVTPVAHDHPVVALRERVIVLPATGAGAFCKVQTMVPAPDATVPVTAIAQFCVVVPAPVRVVGSAVPEFMRSSNETFNAEISASPAVTLARAWYLEYAGIANVARMPMIATTISSSIR